MNASGIPEGGVDAPRDRGCADSLASELAARGVASAAIERLAAFGALLLERNARFNLTAAREPAAVAEHITDSLTVAPFVAGDLVDVGSGGGFPAFPLAIVTGCRVVLIESVMKKARFLEEALLTLGIDGRVVADRAEAAAHEPALRGRFRTATARAVASVSTVLELTLPFLAVGGRAVLQRGALDADARAAASDAALMLGGRVVDEIVLDPSGASARRLLLVEQMTPAARRFPRRAGVPAKRPLCVPEDVRAAT